MNRERYNVLTYIYNCKESIFYSLNQPDKTEKQYILLDWYFKKCQPLALRKVLDCYGIETDTFNGQKIAENLFNIETIRSNISTWYGVKVCILAIYHYMLGFLQDHEFVFKCLSDTQIKLVERVLFEVNFIEYEQTIDNWQIGLNYDLYLLRISVEISNLTIDTIKKPSLKNTLRYFHNLYENFNVKYIDREEHDVRELYIFQIYYEKLVMSLYLSQHSLDSHIMLQLIQFTQHGFKNSWFEYCKKNPANANKSNKEIINISGKLAQQGHLYLISTLKNYPVTSTYQLLLQNLGQLYDFTYADSKYLKHHILHGESDHILFDNCYILADNYQSIKNNDLEYLYTFKDTLNSLTNQVLNFNVFSDSTKNPSTSCSKQKLLSFNHNNLSINYCLEYLLWMITVNPYILSHFKI